LPLALVTATTARMGKERKKKRKLFFLFSFYDLPSEIWW
jgi:hypothetical protein